MDAEVFVTLADHEAGFKIIEVTHRSGAVEQVKLTAPTRRQSRLIGEAIVREQDSWPVVAACKPTADGQAEPYGEQWLDKLTPNSADLVEVTSFALTFGADFQKKMIHLVAMMKTGLAKPEPKSTSGPVSAETK